MKKRSRLLWMAALLSALSMPENLKAQEKMDTTKATDTSKIIVVDQPASFPGGLDGFRKFLEKNLRYPKKAAKQNIQGTVKVQMVVDENGKVKNVTALNDPGGGLGAEAVRVLRDGPDWIPAIDKGKNISYRFTQNITFQIQ